MEDAATEDSVFEQTQQDNPYLGLTFALLVLRSFQAKASAKEK